MRAASIAIAVALAVGWPLTARADDPPATLAVHRDEGALDCPDAAALAQALALADTRRVLKTSEGALVSASSQRYEVTFLRTSGGYEASLRVLGPRAGVRLLADAGPTCVGVAEAVVLTLSLLLDRDAPSRPPAEPPPPEARVAPVVATPERVEAPPAPAATAGSSLGAEASGGVAAGVLRPVAPWLSAGASWRGGRWSASLDAAWIPSQTLALPPGAVDVWFVGAQASACFEPWPWRSARLGLCPAAAAGVVHATARGFTTGRSADEPWLAGGARAVAEGRLFGSLGWRAAAAGLFPLRGQAFRVDGVGVAYDPPPIAGAFELGLTWAIE